MKKKIIGGNKITVMDLIINEIQNNNLNDYDKWTNIIREDIIKKLEIKLGSDLKDLNKKTNKELYDILNHEYKYYDEYLNYTNDDIHGIKYIFGMLLVA
jgi:hypothetical protein